MRRKKRTEIIIEVNEVAVARSPGARVVSWCEGCGVQAAMVSPENAASIKGVDTGTIYRLIETGEVHFLELADGRPRVCLSSLLRP